MSAAEPGRTDEARPPDSDTADRDYPFRGNAIHASLPRMFRRQLMGLLWEHPLTVNSIARQTGARPAEVVEDLRHLQKSLRHTNCRLVVEVAFCRQCEFEFGADKFDQPSRCPKCRSHRVEAPVISVQGELPDEPG